MGEEEETMMSPSESTRSSTPIENNSETAKADECKATDDAKLGGRKLGGRSPKRDHKHLGPSLRVMKKRKKKAEVSIDHHDDMYAPI